VLIKDETIKPIFGLLIFSLFATSVTVPNGAGISALLLFLISAYYLATTSISITLTKAEKVLIASMLAYPSVIAVNMLYHNNWTWGEFDYPVRYWLAAVVFIAVKAIKPSPKYLYVGAICSAIGAGIGALYQTEVLGIYRAYGLAEAQRIGFSLISLLSAMLALCAYKPLNNLNNWRFALIGLALIGGLYASAMSGSRGGWIALPMYMWVLVNLSSKPSFGKQLALLSIMLVVASVFYLNSAFIQARVDSVIPSIYTYFEKAVVSDSVSQRLELWKASWIIFSSAPIFGNGMENFAPLLKELVANNEISPIIQNVRNPHNELFNILPEAGIIGAFFTFLPYLAFSWICNQHIKSNAPLAVAGLIFVIAHLDVGLSFAVMTLAMTSTIWTFGIAIIAGLLSQHRPNEDQPT